MFIHIGYEWLPLPQWELAVKLGNGKAISIDFPHIDPHWDSVRVSMEVSILMAKVNSTLEGELGENFVHIMGEQSYVVEFAIRAKEALMRGDLKFSVLTSVFDNNGFVQFRTMV